MSADVEVSRGDASCASRAQTTQGTENKLSRYRSVRKAQSKPKDEAIPPPPPMPEAVTGASDNVKRSMSRYHRNQAPPTRKRAEPAPPVPVLGPTGRTGSQDRRGARDGSSQSPQNTSREFPRVDPSSFPVPLTNSDYAKRPRGASSVKRDLVDTNATLIEQQKQRKAILQAEKNEGEQVLAKEKERYEKIKAQQRAEREERDKVLRAQRQKIEAEEAEIRRVEREKLEAEMAVKRAKEEERERQIQEKEEAKQRVKDEQRRVKEEQQRVKDEQQRLKEDQQRIREEEKQRMKDEQQRQREEEKQRQREEERATRKRRPTNVSVPPPPSSSEEKRDPTLPSSRGSGSSPSSSRRIGGFFRKRKDEETPRTSMATEERRPRTSHAAPPSPPSPPKWAFPTIRPGGGGIVPLSDAPKSGVLNAERRVRIQCGRSEITLPVDQHTSALQLIRSASNVMSEQFDPRAAVMHECLNSQELFRPLRMYEHVRSVMNSWDDDSQHSLVIEPSEVDSDKELFASFAPQTEPRQFCRFMFYQYKPGKWDERWVTVRPDGQILVAKNQQGKDQTNVCVMSDFDIYRKMQESRKRKKSSKKVYISIKSQEKSAMFMDKSNYIHHFYSEDKITADEFFKHIQNWRSYFLVQKMGQGQVSRSEETGDGGKHHTRTKSAESHYMLGSFNDLGLDFSDYSRAPEEPVRPRKSFDEDKPLLSYGLTLPSAQMHSKVMHQRQLSTRKQQPRAPPPAMRQPLPSSAVAAREDALQALNANSKPRSSWDSTREGSFNPGGLLGPGYEQRQHAAKPSQDASNGLNRRSSVRSNHSLRRNSFDSATLGRRNSTRQPDFGKPLLDFRPQYKEPPQFATRGKGYKPENKGQGGLVESATSLDTPFQLPGANDWRARPTTSSANPSGLGHTKSMSRSKSTRRPNGAAIPEDPEPFTGGLLAQTGPGWGSGNKGHGVVSGNRTAKNGPMLDMNEPSMFGNGTLLRKMEKNNMGNPAGSPYDSGTGGVGK